MLHFKAIENDVKRMVQIFLSASPPVTSKNPHGRSCVRATVCTAALLFLCTTYRKHCQPFLLSLKAKEGQG
jgi:hypothetical protein